MNRGGCFVLGSLGQFVNELLNGIGPESGDVAGYLGGVVHPQVGPEHEVDDFHGVEDEQLGPVVPLDAQGLLDEGQQVVGIPLHVDESVGFSLIVDCHLVKCFEYLPTGLVGPVATSARNLGPSDQVVPPGSEVSRVFSQNSHSFQFTTL